jgi:hypothetical protein
VADSGRRDGAGGTGGSADGSIDVGDAAARDAAIRDASTDGSDAGVRDASLETEAGAPTGMDGGAGRDTDGSADGSTDSDGATGSTVGATTPFISYEAEAGRLGGGATIVSVSLASPPTTQFSSPELESSGHAFVRLDATGQYVEWVNNTGKGITAIDVRASIPDAPIGGGTTATLDLLVNGSVRQTLSLSSRQSWGYEGNNHYNSESQNPADGNPRTFFDDVHTFIAGAPVAPGDTIRLQKNAGNAASFYDIDVVDLEAPPPPLPRPANSLSITADCGAVASDQNVDNSAAGQSCISNAEAQHKSVWIPEGIFYMKSIGGLRATGITIEGAGMWHSTIYRNMALPNVNGSGQAQPLGAIFNLTSTTVRNFALDSNAISRAQIDGCGGAMDTTGTNWVADSIWTQHTMSGFWASGTGGIVKNCRLTSIWADGCNVNNVSNGGTVGNDLTVQNNFVRGTGDDAIAINSVDYNGDPPNQQTYTPMSNIKVLNNTSIAMWGGKGVAVYGGGGHLVANNFISDTARYIGLGVGKFGVNGSNLTSATVTGNTVLRCGGNAYVQQQPALHIGNGGDGHETGNVAGATVSNNIVIDALYNGVGFSASNDVLFQSNTVTHPGLDGIVISPPFYPAPTGSAAIRDNRVLQLNSGERLSRIYRAALWPLSVGTIGDAALLDRAAFVGRRRDGRMRGGRRRGGSGRPRRRIEKRRWADVTRRRRWRRRRRRGNRRVGR